MIPVRKILNAIATAALLLSASAAQAITWDFTSGGSSNTNTGTYYGNVRTFTETGDNPFSETITATAWADTGLPQPPGTLQNAFLGKYSTGLGACNRGEGSISYCDGQNPLHQFDNFGQNDLVMFRMDQGQYEFNEIVIDPFGTYDRDVSFWIGNVGDLPSGADLTGIEVDELESLYGFTKYNDYNGQGSGPLTIDLMNVQGNTLLFGALFPPNGQVDRFKIASLSATLVPVPAAVWLMGSGLLALAGLRRKA